MLTSYHQDLTTVNDGSLVLLSAGGMTQPAIKGADGDRTALTFLADSIERTTGEVIYGPVIYFGDDAECLSLGRDFTIDYDPMTVEFYRGGECPLGTLAVDANGRMYIRAQSLDGRGTFVATDTGGSPNGGPMALFHVWSLSILRPDGARQELYRHERPDGDE